MRYHGRWLRFMMQASRLRSFSAPSMSPLYRAVISTVVLLTLVNCASERRSQGVPPRWSVGGYRLGFVPDSLRRLLSCTDRDPDASEPWVRECYGGPDVQLGFDSAGNLSHITEDMAWGEIVDAEELWYRARQRFVEALGTPDSVTKAIDTFESLTKGLSDSVRKAANLKYEWMGNKLNVFWSRVDVGDCAMLEVMSTPGFGPGLRARTFLTIGSCH